MRIGMPRWMRREMRSQSVNGAELSIAARAGDIRRVITEVLLVVVALLLAWGVMRELRRDTISVLPVELPEAMVRDEISALGASQAIAQQMANFVAATVDVVSRPEGQDGQLALGGVASQVPDIELPGQSMSFRSVVLFLENVLDTADVALSVTVSKSAHSLRAVIVVRGGPYDGASRVVEMPATVPVARLLEGIAAASLAVTQPYMFARVLMARDPQITGATSLECPVTFTCTPETAAGFLEPLLRNGFADDDVWAHHGLAVLALRLDDPATAFRHCEAAIAADRDVPWPYIDCAYAVIGPGRKNSDKAIAYLDSARAAGPRNPNVHSRIGDVLLGLEQSESALESYQKAVQLDPSDVYALIGAGTAYRGLRKWQEAAESYERAVLLSPNEPYALGGLGAALTCLQKYDQAIPHLSKSLRLAPDYKVAKTSLTAAEQKQSNCQSVPVRS